MLNDIDYAGCQESLCGHYKAGSESNQWLPLRVADRFVYLWSNLDTERACFFLCIDNDARLV